MEKKKIFKQMKYLLKFLPDPFYIQLYYFFQFKHLCNLKNPQTFNEKLNWLKLNYKDPKYIDYVDKYKAKKIAEQIIGKEYIIPELGVWNTFDEIDFSKLPNQFVLKCNHDSEGLVIVPDKHKFDKDKAKIKITKALNSNFFYIGREWVYKEIQPRIIAEKYMEDSIDNELRDYKFFCFNGIPKIMYIASGRSKNKTSFDFFDMNFNHLNVKQHYPNATIQLKKPQTFNKMIELSKKLSKNIPHVRIDFYEVDGKCYFGEFTFFSYSGFQPFLPSSFDVKMGNYLILPNAK